MCLLCREAQVAFFDLLSFWMYPNTDYHADYLKLKNEYRWMLPAYTRFIIEEARVVRLLFLRLTLLGLRPQSACANCSDLNI